MRQFRFILLSLVYRIALVLSLVGLPGIAAAADQLGCTTIGECYDDCCAGLGLACPPSCRNVCGNPPNQSRCPSAYLYCKFNTNVADWNWMELSNLGSERVLGNYQYFNNSGSPIANSTSFQLNSLQRHDVDVHGAVGPGKVGQVIVGVYGDSDNLAASVSFYELEGGSAHQTTSIVCERRARTIIDPS